MLRELKRAAEGSVLETHPHYRTAIGVLAVSLPPLLVLSSLLRQQELQGSISAYYFTSARDCVRRRPLGDRRLPVLLSVSPSSSRVGAHPGRTDQDRRGRRVVRQGRRGERCPGGDLPDDATTCVADAAAEIGMVHGVSAAVLFTCLSLFPLLLFSQSRVRGRVYRRYGWVMIALLLSVVGYALSPDSLP